MPMHCICCRDRLLEFETIDSVHLPGLSERRHPVLIGGLVMLHACFKALEIESIKVSPYALREGVLHDLLGRLEHQDPRAKTIDAFMSRYSVDREQVERVKANCTESLRQDFRWHVFTSNPPAIAGLGRRFA